LTRKPLSHQKPVRRKIAHRHASTRRKRLGKRAILVLTAFGTTLFLLAWGILARHFAPVSNTDLSRFDAIIVLGYHADSDGNPTPKQLARVTEAVREYQRGVAPHLILTGGAVHNQFVEAQVMARVARSQGIPESSIFVEPEAKDTVQNACYSARIMKAHGWRSAEVVSSAAHLPRVGIIFTPLPILWRTHAAPPLWQESATYPGAVSVLETLKTMRYLVWTRQIERCEP
jgi:uncharacterized SAM-binding protein YcdF (DUF218 family)